MEPLIISLKVNIGGKDAISYYGEYDRGTKTARERAAEELQFFAARLLESDE